MLHGFLGDVGVAPKVNAAFAGGCIPVLQVCPHPPTPAFARPSAYSQNGRRGAGVKVPLRSGRGI